MSLNIRGSAPVVEQQPQQQPWNASRSTSSERRNTVLVPTGPPSDTTTTTVSSGAAQYTRPEVQVPNANQNGGISASEASIFSPDTQTSRPDPPAKLLRFKIPTLQIRPRQDEPTAKRRAPELFTPRGNYASESDNESLANSSDASASTQATSVISSDDDNVRDSEAFNQIRQSIVPRRPSVTSGPSRRQIEYNDTSSQEPERYLHIHIKSNKQQQQQQQQQQHQQKASSSGASKAAITSRRTPMITQAPVVAHTSDSTTAHQLVPSRRRNATSPDDSSSIRSEIDSLKSEMDTLRGKESKATRELSDMQQRLKDLQKDKEELRAEKSKVQEAKDKLEADLNKQAKQLDKTRDKFDEAKKTIEKLEQERDSKLEKAKKERALTVQRIHKERDQTQDRIDKDHDAAMKKLEEERDELSAAKSSLDAKLRDVEVQLAHYKEINENLRTNYEALEKQASNQTDFKAQVEAKTINLKRELGDTVAIQKAQENSYKAQITRLEISLEARELKIKNLEDELAKSTTNGVELTSARDKLDLELKNQQNRVESLEKDISSLDKDKAELQLLLNDLRQDRTSMQEIHEASKDSLTKEIASKDASITDLEGENQKLKSELESAKEEQKAAETKAEEIAVQQETVQKQADTLNEQVEQLTKEKDDASAELQQLKEELETVRAENRTLRGEDDSPSEEELARAAELKALQDRIAELEAQKAEVEAKAAETENQLKSEKALLESAEHEVGALHQRVVDLMAQLAEITKRGRPKPKRNPKKAEKILAVRCPRDLSKEIAVVRRKNIHQVISQAAMAESSSTD